jgi:hypothetical protein
MTVMAFASAVHQFSRAARTAFRETEKNSVTTFGQRPRQTNLIGTTARWSRSPMPVTRATISSWTGEGIRANGDEAPRTLVEVEEAFDRRREAAPPIRLPKRIIRVHPALIKMINSQAIVVVGVARRAHDGGVENGSPRRRSGLVICGRLKFTLPFKS